MDSTTPSPLGGLTDVVGPLNWGVAVMASLSIIVGLFKLARGLAPSPSGYHDSTSDKSQGIGLIVGGFLAWSSVAIVNRLLGSSSEPPAPDVDVPTPAPEPAPPSAAEPPAEPIDWTPFLWVMAGLVALTVVVVLIRSITKAAAAKKTARKLDDEETLLRRDDWANAERIFNDVRTALTEFELDPYGWIRTPALRDVTVPHTAAFFDAFDQAQALHTASVPNDTDRITAFAAAAHKAHRAWITARAHAESLGTSMFDPQDRKKLRQAESALAVALNEAASEAERLSALDTVNRLTTGLVTVPDKVAEQAHTAIAAAHRKQLTH